MLRKLARMDLIRFRWLFMATLILLFILVEVARYQFFPSLDSWTGRLMMDLVVLGGAIFVFGGGFELLTTMQRRLDRQRRELVALHQGVWEIYGAGSFDAVVQKVVEKASELAQARYTALLLINSAGEISHITTAGFVGRPAIGEAEQGSEAEPAGATEPANEASPAEQSEPPTTADGQLSLPDIERDPTLIGMPLRNGAPGSRLSIPVECKEPFLARLIVAEKSDERAFTQRDEATLVRFSTAAAIAIDNAYLHERLRTLALAEERERIGGEIHDGMAQILAYVNTKAQAVTAYMMSGRADEAHGQLEQLARAARQAYTDARESILALRTQVGPDQPLGPTLTEFLDAWQAQSGIRAELEIDEDLELEPMVELQLLRIIQEALANTRKHSGATEARIALRRSAGGLSVLVEDNGQGFDPAALARSDFPRFGLSIMRERTESVGGALEIDSSPGGGTRVKIDIPLTRVR
jgi:signal transduction histidine kinase